MCMTKRYVKSTRRQKKREEEQKTSVKKAEVKFKKKFETKHWPRTIKYLEGFAKEECGRRCIKLSKLVNRINPGCEYLVKNMLKSRLEESGFRFAREGKHDEEVCW